MARDLSVCIPARNEEWLSRTIADVLEHSEMDTEVICVLDGAWADPPIPDNSRVRLVHVGKSIGQRAACNLAARMSTAKYIMKLDAHCSLGQGFDRILMENCDYDWTVIPYQYNFHVFDWVCKKCSARFYQGPVPNKIDRTRTDKGMLAQLEAHDASCGSTEFERDVVWKRRDSRRSTYWSFDRDLHFQYDGDGGKKGDITDTMSLLGACWFLHRERYWELDGSDERTGSWGQQGTEIACKTWLSGGRLVCNKKTWFAHLFRTQGHLFGFPWPISGSDQDKARIYSQKCWREGLWPKMQRPLSSLVEQFWPVKGWSQEDVGKLKAIEAPKWSGYSHVKPGIQVEGAWVTATLGAGNSEAEDEADVSVTKAEGDISSGSPRYDFISSAARSAARNESSIAPTISPSSTLVNRSAAVLYYTDYRLDERIFTAAQKQLKRSVNGHQVISVSLDKPVDVGENIVLGRARGAKTLFLQILAGLEKSTADYVFLAEHDCLYPKGHFEFIPPRDDRYYYNIACFKVSAVTGQAVTYRTQQLSGLCANRLLLIEHYHRRLAKMAQNVRDCIRQGIPVKNDGHSRHAGWEPGNHREPRGVDNYKSESWMSAVPYVDIRDHGFNHTKTRWSVEEFRDKRTAEGWTESDEIPHWGTTKGRFWEFLAEVTGGR